MKKSIHIILLSFTFVFISSLAGSLFAQDFFVKGDAKIQNKKKWVPNEILVKFNSGTSGQAIADINARHGSQVLSTSGSDGFKRLKIPKNKTVEQMVAIYTKNPNVEYAEPNFIASAFYTPNDPFYTYQWHMDQINMGSAWDYTSGAGVVIAVIDTGVAYEDYTDGVAYKKSAGSLSDRFCTRI